MKLRTTTPASISSTRLFVIAVSVVVMAFAVPMQITSQVSANNFDAQIKALEQDISRYDAEAGRLAGEADTLQREVNRINNEKATIQAQVDISQAKANQLKADIQANEEKLSKSKDALGTIISDLYVNDQVTPIEMLASSKGIGDFINKQEYRTITREQITSTINEVKKLKAELEKQKTEVDAVLKDQEAQRNLLAAKEAEQANLLAKTRGDEAAYKNLSSESNARKDQLQREQQAAIERAINRGGGGGSAVAGDPNKGGYPANLANSNYYNPVVDPWGMYSRQCVSYTAWKVFQKNGSMPYWGGDRYVKINGQNVFTSGHAKYWPTSARAAGIPTGSSPRVGSVGVITSGQYGHVVWVESINANGTINISQYNEYDSGRPGDPWGHYSERYNVSPGAYDTYIYF